MASSDGSIRFSTELDNSELEKGIKEAEKEIEELKEKAASAKASGSTAEATEYYKQLKDAYERYRDLMAKKTAIGIDASAAAEAAEAASLSIRERIGGAMAGLAGGMRSAFATVGSVLGGIFARIRQIASTIFTLAKGFAIIAPLALAATFIASIIGRVRELIASNAQMQQAIASLSAVFSGFVNYAAQAVANFLLPIIVGAINVVTSLFTMVARLIDRIFGTNIMGSIASAMQDTAGGSAAASDAIDDQAASTKKLAKATKDANRQLMGFDELNVLDAPQEEPEDYDEAPTAGIGSVGAVAPGIAAANGELGIMGDLLKMIEDIFNRILNDAEGPFARIREGLELIKEGWDKVIQGFKSGDWKMVWEGIGDIVIGALYVIDGAFNAFMDWLDELTGGRFTDVFQGMGKIVHGFVELVEGLLRGDLPLAFQGLTDMVDGAGMVLNGIVDAVIGFAKDAVTGLFDWLSQKFPELAPMFDTIKNGITTALDAIGTVLHGFIDGAVQFVQGALSIVQGILSGDRDKVLQGLAQLALGVMTAIRGILDALAMILAPVWEWFKSNVVDPVVNYFTENFKPLADWADKWVVQPIKGFFDTLRQFFTELWDGIVAAAHGDFGPLSEWFDKRVVQPIKGFFQPFIEFFGALWDTVVEKTRFIWEPIANWFSKNVIEPVKGFFQNAWNAITGFFSNAKTNVQGVWQTVSGWFDKNVITPVRNFFQNAWNAITGFVKTAWTNISNAWNGASTWFSNTVLTPIKNFFTNAWNAITGFVKTAWTNVSNAWNAASRWFDSTVLTPIKNFFSTAWSNIKNNVTGVWDAVKNVWNIASNWFNNTVLNPVKNAFSNAWNTLKTGASNAWNGIKNVFSNVANFFKNTFSNAWQGILNIFRYGGQIFNGVTNAIKNAFTGVANQIISGLNWAIAQPLNGINGIFDSMRNWNVFDQYIFSWLPSIGVPSIPYLAQGAVIPANREFLAVLGDQSNGRNLEAPEDLLRQIVREESGNASLESVLVQILAAVREGKELWMDGEKVGGMVSGYQAAMQRVNGW